METIEFRALNRGNMGDMFARVKINPNIGIIHF